MKKVTKNALALGVFVVVMSVVFLINRNATVQKKPGNLGNDYIYPDSDTAVLYEYAPGELEELLNTRKSKQIDQIIYYELLPSESIPKGTKYLGSKVEGKLEKRIENERIITLNFSEKFISQGAGFVYNESIPEIIEKIENRLSSLRDADAEFIFLIEGEPLEKALERKYKK